MYTSVSADTGAIPHTGNFRCCLPIQPFQGRSAFPAYDHFLSGKWYSYFGYFVVRCPIQCIAKNKNLASTKKPKLTAEHSIHGAPGQEAQVHGPAPGLADGASGACDSSRGVQHLAEAFFFSQAAVLRHLVVGVMRRFRFGGCVVSTVLRCTTVRTASSCGLGAQQFLPRKYKSQRELFSASSRLGGRHSTQHNALQN